jgi:flagellar basal body-associated protein FliL
MYNRIMSRVPTRRGGGGGGLTLVIILVLMMCVSVIVGAGGYMLFKPKKDAKDAKDNTVADLKAKVEALENDDNADPAELATAPNSPLLKMPIQGMIPQLL